MAPRPCRVCRNGKSDGRTSELWFRAGTALPVRFQFIDTLRPDARATIDALKARGLSLFLLSGDREPATSRIAEAAGIADWKAMSIRRPRPMSSTACANRGVAC